MVKRFALLIMLVLSISACGYRGSLYLPDDPPSSEQPPEQPPASQSSGETQ